MAAEMRMDVLPKVLSVFDSMDFFRSLRLLLSILTVITVSAAVSCNAEDLMVGEFSQTGLAGWMPEVFKGHTVYRLVRDQRTVVVQATSKAAASGLVRKLSFDPARYRYLHWSWKIDHILKKGDGRTKAGDDYAARVYVVFPGRFFWQTKAINYIWANRLAKGSSLANAFTNHAMMIAVESGPGMAGRWVDEKRDILADYRRLFGRRPDRVGAVAIMTDTDNTGESAVAWYGDITVSTSP